VYGNVGMAYQHCPDEYGITVGEAMDMAVLSGGGYAMALAYQNRYAGSCVKQNYIEERMVACYYKSTDSAGGSRSSQCTNGNRDTSPMKDLIQYMKESANNDPTDSNAELGPPANLYYTPFNKIKGIWQTSAYSAQQGLLHFSTILQDNSRSNLNAELVRLVYEGEFNAVSLLAVDNAALDGNALFSVLRTRCGQSDEYWEDASSGDGSGAGTVCGTALDLPGMQVRSTTITTVLLMLFSTVYVVFFVYYRFVTRKTDTTTDANLTPTPIDQDDPTRLSGQPIELTTVRSRVGVWLSLPNPPTSDKSNGLELASFDKSSPLLV